FPPSRNLLFRRQLCKGTQVKTFNSPCKGRSMGNNMNELSETISRCKCGIFVKGPKSGVGRRPTCQGERVEIFLLKMGCYLVEYLAGKRIKFLWNFSLPSTRVCGRSDRADRSRGRR